MLTGGLIGVLSDLIQTADRDPEAGVLGGVLLHTARGHHGGEPARVDLLAGASTNRYVAGHTYTWCTGQLGDPSLWSIRDARNVIGVFKAARGKDKDNTHAVEIRRSGGEVEIREDPNLIDEGVALTFAEGDAAQFPARTLYTVLDAKQRVVEVRDGMFIDAGPRTDLVPAVLTPFLKVAARRKDLLQLYRTHQHVPVLIQIGDTYRGLLMPYRTETALTDDHPGADVHPPDLEHPRWARAAPPPADADNSDEPLLLLQLDDPPDPDDAEGSD